MEKMSEAAQRLIDQHLEAIAVSLRTSGMSRSVRRSILDDIENQIYEMLEERTAGNPQENEVRAVLAELDAPESYLTSSDLGERESLPTEGGKQPSDVNMQFSTPAHLSKCAVFGAIWSMIFFVDIPLYFIAMHSGVKLGSALGAIWWGLLQITAISAPFGATLLGWIALSQIRHSQGRLYGRGLAIYDAIVNPIIILVLLLLVVG